MGGWGGEEEGVPDHRRTVHLTPPLTRLGSLLAPWERCTTRAQHHGCDEGLLPGPSAAWAARAEIACATDSHDAASLPHCRGRHAPTCRTAGLELKVSQQKETHTCLSLLINLKKTTIVRRADLSESGFSSIVTFLRKMVTLQNGLLIFLGKETHSETKIMDIFEDFDEKSYNNNGKPLKSSRILRVKRTRWISP